MKNTQLDIANAPIEVQKKELIRIVKLNPVLNELLNKTGEHIKFPWYYGAGCINQTVWNHLTNKEITQGIGDYDLVYWDDHYSREKEVTLENKLSQNFSHLNFNKLDVTNEAGVHTWFHEKFGQKIEKYKNLEHSISTWPSTATCIGVTKRNNNYFVVAPYGLQDLFNMTVRINKPYTIEKVFETKTSKWLKKWPELKIMR